MLYGEKTRLRRIERSDIPTFVRWFGDPEVREFLMLNRPISHAEEEQWFENHLNDKSGEIFAIETNEDGTARVHIGNIGLHSINWVHRRAELGIVIGEKEYWGKGYGSAGSSTKGATVKPSSATAVTMTNCTWASYATSSQDKPSRLNAPRSTREPFRWPNNTQHSMKSISLSGQAIL